MNPPEIEGGWLITADASLVELSNGDILAPTAQVIPEIVISPPSKPKFSKNAIRTSLKASTLDGVFYAIFSNITGGVLVNNFLLELGANATEIGMLTSIPMLINLLQPIGAHLSELTVSRRSYNLWIYGLSRLLWLFLVLGIGLANWHYIESHQLITWVLGVVLMSNVLGALGSASWLSWMTFLVPSRLRGRYFGFRNSVVSLTNLISVPLAGWIIVVWQGGSLQGYGIVLVLGVISGFLSLGFQFFKADVNPQEQKLNLGLIQSNDFLPEIGELKKPLIPHDSILRDYKFLAFLLYFSSWMFAINLSGPFFTLYMLDNLSIDVRYVTLYSSLLAGAYLLSLIAWGKLSDRIGNRSILLSVGILTALTPLLWLGMGANEISIWLWLPLLHLLLGGTGAALDLCTTNLQLAVAPIARQSQSFALVAAIGGVSGALATTAGGFLVQLNVSNGFVFLFALSSILRFATLIPLIFVREK